MKFNQNINGIDISAEYPDSAVNAIFIPLLKKLTDMHKSKGKRILAFLAAPPAAGKSTLVAFLEHLSKEMSEIMTIQAIGMDGFHRHQDYLLNNSILKDGKEIPLVKIKGAPVTFDLDGLKERIIRVGSGENCPWPVYDRLLHNPVENAITVTGDIIVLEGNYLLLDYPGWKELKQYADYTIFITAEPDDLKKRLIERKKATSAETYEQAEAFVSFSDIPNAKEVLEHSQKADMTLQMLKDGTYIPC